MCNPPRPKCINILFIIVLILTLSMLTIGCPGGGGGGDDDDLITWYEDSDGDGYGDPQSTTEAESQPVGYVSDNTDCDDTNQTIFPGATENCGDGIDQDCDDNDLLCFPTDGLIAHYPFNGNANDESGNGNDGIIYGNSVQFVSGIFDQAISFDNSSSGTFTVNDYVELPKLTASDLTVSHWVKYISGSSTSYSGCTYSIGTWSSNHFQFEIKNTGFLRGKIRRSGQTGNSIATSEIDLSDHEWHFISITINNEFMKIYENGLEIDSVNLGFDLDFVDSFHQVALHRFPDGMSSRFTGEMDNLRVYNRSLSPSEISVLYNE